MSVLERDWVCVCVCVCEREKERVKSVCDFFLDSSRPARENPFAFSCTTNAFEHVSRNHLLLINLCIVFCQTSVITTTDKNIVKSNFNRKSRLVPIMKLKWNKTHAVTHLTCRCEVTITLTVTKKHLVIFLFHFFVFPWFIHFFTKCSTNLSYAGFKPHLSYSQVIFLLFQFCLYCCNTLWHRSILLPIYRQISKYS